MIFKKPFIAAALSLGSSTSAVGSAMRGRPESRSAEISSEVVGAVKIDPSNDRGTWEGWGLSLAWLANLFGEDTKLADAFFTM